MAAPWCKTKKAHRQFLSKVGGKGGGTLLGFNIDIQSRSGTQEVGYNKEEIPSTTTADAMKDTIQSSP